MRKDFFDSEIENNLFESWKYLSSVPDVELLDEPEILRFTSGVDYPLLNCVLRSHIPGWNMHNKVSETLDFFRGRNLPMLWWITPSARPGNLSTELEKEGLAFVEAAAGMGLELDDFDRTEKEAATFSIAMVTNREDLNKWISVFGRSFEMPENATEFFLRTLGYLGLGSGPFSHFVCLMDDIPVSCSSIYVSGKTAGLYNVGTLPEARGNGAGRAISIHSVLKAIQSGCDTMVLHATESGEPLYKQLRFKKYCEIKAYAMQ